MRGRNHVAGVLDRGAHAIAALSHRRIRQAHGVKVILLRDHAAIVNLHIDEVGVDSVDCRAENFKEHYG